MKTITVADVELRFSDIIGQVKNGEKFQILSGSSPKPVAMIIPMQTMDGHRKIGILEGIGIFNEKENSKITEEEFLTA